jgi:CBS domain containing-hemolysin-like protein
MIFLILEALFSGSEIAFVASDINKIRQRAESGSKSAALALKLLKRPEWFLATALTGTDICIIVNTSLATAVFISLFGVAKGGAFAAIVMIPLILVVAELIPKCIFQQRAESAAIWMSRYIQAASWVFYPLVFIVAWISRGTVYLLTGTPMGSYSPYITKEGLKFLLRERSENGDIQRAEKEMIRRVFDFTETAVSRIMVPLSNVAAIKDTGTIGEAVTLIRERGFSRIPVYRESIFEITGILHSFDLLKAFPGTEGGPIRPYVRPNIFYVPETKSASELLLEMQQRGELLAVVVDEYGGAVGIISVEDLLEEVVGEIEDEYDSGEKPYVKIATDRYLFHARTTLDRIREVIQIEIPEGAYETLGGFMLDRLGHIPKRSESVTEGGLLFIVEDADAKSVKEVLIVVPDEKGRS